EPPGPAGPPFFPYPTLFRSTLAHELGREQVGGEPRGDPIEHDRHDHLVRAGFRLEIARDPRPDPPDEDGTGEGGDEEKRTGQGRSEEHTSELQSRFDLVCRL